MRRPRKFFRHGPRGSLAEALADLALQALIDLGEEVMEMLMPEDDDKGD